MVKAFEVERPKKRLFVALMSLSLLVVGVMVYAVWRVSYLGLQEISEYLPLILGALLAGIFLFTGLGIVGIVGAIMGVPFLSVFQRKTYALINLLFPIAIMMGKVFGFDRRKIECSFVAVSNQIIHHQHIKVRPEELLVVTPHCLQLASCPHKITRDPMANCKRCGQCDIGALVTLAEEMGFHFFVVTGGTLARQTVKKIRPKAVLAIACERDLTSGIQDVYPLPAVGVMNIRPNGPCYNTHVDINMVRSEIESMLIKEENVNG
ncbi:DUF116 domain-containing protein [Schwartzia succinivorans]|jgi:hypothetical protein|uniref:DUF116 domain-containing protein n=1 Tax=Schwartzia succinivorans DSM 10502 TaxID=1123243 RepID=A0A1M4WEY3_9FIRM|nr:DUF116 domain-containing protein [Schwartzia succinivorans]MBQ1469883.1 DUF116 domain-containing protein [Schwartzia sp. (in: firmicutes)]MBQ1918128.1 DUF116 domain-containing protein [Schwartzia sp. (in: firmicutes)]MBQ2048050.1 DUF116 domain-containing protein [Schwartzia sp. (in: firmicutes)]MBQ3863039.1 DUF116 domain-containing protein [Schwartzia sp. (in: firmicutes)]MBQ4152203.1 DUF116 domain-containing protein [Schwartzia sp. (in: firmicutes)]